MARGTSLGVLLDDLRAEVGHSLQPNLGKSTRDVLINMLQRTQRRLWDDYSWFFTLETLLLVRVKDIMTYQMI